jgi:hypothetical protein
MQNKVISKQVHVVSCTTHINIVVITPFQGSKHTTHWRWLAHKVDNCFAKACPLSFSPHLHSLTFTSLLFTLSYNLCHTGCILTSLLTTPQKNVCFTHTYPYPINTTLYTKINSKQCGNIMHTTHDTLMIQINVNRVISSRQPSQSPGAFICILRCNCTKTVRPQNSITKLVTGSYD